MGPLQPHLVAGTRGQGPGGCWEGDSGPCRWLWSALRPQTSPHPPTSGQLCAVHWRCQTGPCPPQPTPSTSLHWRVGEPRLPRRAEVGFLSRCLGWPPPWVQSSLVALVKAKRHQSARSFLGQVPEDMRGPRAHVGWPRPCTISTIEPSGALADPHGSQQARPPLPQLYGGKVKGPELPVLGNLVHPSSLSAASAAGGPAWWEPGCAQLDGPGLGCRSRARAEVSGTEVTSKEKGLWFPVCTHRPALPRDSLEGRRRKVVPLPFSAVFIFRKINKSSGQELLITVITTNASFKIPPGGR